MKYKALIIGAGQIAAGFDGPDCEDILTHAHAYKKHGGFDLLGFYDVDFAKARAMARKWQCLAYDRLEDAGEVDVVSICVPDAFHVRAAVMASRLLSPKCIFIEKPVAKTRDEFLELASLNRSVIVNYSRRFSSSFQNLANRIDAGEFGDYQTGSGYYCKGFRHNGSHMIDLLRMLVGEVAAVDEVSRIVDFSDDDPTKTAIVRFSKGGTFVMHGCDARKFTVFELDLIFSKARVRISDGGHRISIDRVEDDVRYSGYRKLGRRCDEETDLPHSLFNAADVIYKVLSREDGADAACGLNDGWEAVKYG